MVDARLLSSSRTAGRIIVFLFVAALCLLNLTRGATAEELEIADLITQTDNPVVRAAFVDLDAGRRERKRARLAVFGLQRQSRIQRSVETEEWCERLVDAYRRHAPSE